MGRGVNADDGRDQGDRCEEDQQEPDQWTFSGRILFACYHNNVVPNTSILIYIQMTFFDRNRAIFFIIIKPNIIRIGILIIFQTEYYL